jgi:fibronectin-binding autotransporter adhesin
LAKSVASATDTLNFDITLGSNQTWRVTAAGATLDVEGVVSGKHRLSKSDAGTLVLGAGNLYNGTTLTAGALIVGSGQSLGPGTLAFHGGQLQSRLPVTLANAFSVTANSAIGGSQDIAFTGAGKFTAGVALTVTSTGTTTLSGKLTGAGALAESAGTGTLVLAGDNGSASTTVNSGNLVILTDSALGTGILTLNGGTLQADAAVNLANNYSVAGSATVGGSNSVTFSGSGTLTTGNTLTVTNTATTSFTGMVMGSGNLTEAAGAGTLLLTAANSFTGTTTLTGGTLILGDSGALGAGVLDLDGGMIQFSSDLTLPNAFTVSNSSMVGGSNNVVFSGPGTLNLGTLLTVNNPAGTITLAGDIGGAGGLSMVGTGQLVVSGNNTFTGATIVPC